MLTLAGINANIIGLFGLWLAGLGVLTHFFGREKSSTSKIHDEIEEQSQD